MGRPGVAADDAWRTTVGNNPVLLLLLVLLSGLDTGRALLLVPVLVVLLLLLEVVLLLRLREALLKSAGVLSWVLLSSCEDVHAGPAVERGDGPLGCTCGVVDAVETRG